MSDTAALIKNYYDQFNKRNWTGFLGLLDENVAHDLNQGSRQTGKKEFAKFMEEMDAWYDEQVVDLAVMVSPTNPSRAAAEFTIKGVYKKSAPGLPPANGQKYTLPVGAFFEIQNGKVKRITNYYNMADWLKQVQA